MPACESPALGAEAIYGTGRLVRWALNLWILSGMGKIIVLVCAAE